MPAKAGEARTPRPMSPLRGDEDGFAEFRRLSGETIRIIF